VTPNKKANSGTLPYYRALAGRARAAGTHYLYEATVGAGLPVIQTLRDLRETGDDITSIEGIFSGTLAYLFNVFDGSEAFSSIVRAAKAEGLHRTGSARRPVGHGCGPQADHSGARDGPDLGNVRRESDRAGAQRPWKRQRRGIHGTAAGVRCRHGGDARGARAKNQVLRYVGRIDAGGKATVGLTRLDAKHAFANIALTDNVVRFATRRYCDNPLIVQGRARDRKSRPAVCSPICCACPPIWARICRLTIKRIAVLTDVTAFAPATVANVGIGFDILGHTVEAVGDRVRMRRIDEPVVRIRSITGVAGDLPVEPMNNTAGARFRPCTRRWLWTSGSNRHRQGHSAGLGDGRLGRIRGGRRGGRQRVAGATHTADCSF
jgi:hypothetical protein